MLSTLYTVLSVLALALLAVGVYIGGRFQFIGIQKPEKKPLAAPATTVIILGLAATLFVSLSYTSISGVTVFETCETLKTNKTTTQIDSNTSETNTEQSCQPHTWRSTALAYLYGALSLITLLLILIHAI